MDASITGPGLPVEIGRIDKELGKLWESADGTKTRASLINLVIYTEDPGSLEENTNLIAAIAGKHACRAILILADPGASGSGASAWISAHCRFSGKGENQICSEQITFRLDGGAAAALPNIVFSHLDSDLPLCLWWRAPFREPLDSELWSWIDRLIFDSSSWAEPLGQFALVKRIDQLAESHAILCDLNWARLHSWRVSLANLFDHPAALAILGRIDSLCITSAPEFRTTAFLLAGWLAAQLRWKLLPDEHCFECADRRRIAFNSAESAGEGISLVELCCADACFHLAREAGFFRATLRAPGVPESEFTLPASPEDVTDTLLGELGRGGRHPLYAKSLEAMLPLMRFRRDSF